MAQISITEDAEALSRYLLDQAKAFHRRRCAAENVSCGTMTLPGNAARCCAICVAALWGGWGAELEFWGECFDELWRDAFDGEEVFGGADWVCGAGGYDALGEFFADAGE